MAAWEVGPAGVWGATLFDMVSMECGGGRGNGGCEGQDALGHSDGDDGRASLLSGSSGVRGGGEASEGSDDGEELHGDRLFVGGRLVENKVVVEKGLGYNSNVR